MPEGIEIETKVLQETIEGLQEEQKERAETDRRTVWKGYMAMTTAVLAVFAALGALRAGALVNEAGMNRMKASDAWNEYQADRTKDHFYRIRAQELFNAGVKPPVGALKESSEDDLKPLSLSDWLGVCIREVRDERVKEDRLAHDARELEEQSERQWHLHHRFTISVTLIQVAIALGAVAALSRSNLVWALSLLVGGVGIFFFANGMLAH
jgi:hypothetical protein